jgi:DNA-binding MarR family transcriptional regulator
MAKPTTPTTREERLQAALHEATGGVTAAAAKERAANSERRRYLGRAWRAEALEFVNGITKTAELIERARAPNGELVFRRDPQFALLLALERLGGYPSISEIARALHMSRQAAGRIVAAAAQAAKLELLPDPYDRRSIQVALTPVGQRELAAMHARELTCITELLNGLGTRDMRLVEHVLRVIRRRLQRNERLDALREDPCRHDNRESS